MAFSAGIFAGLIPVFWSLWSVALAQDDFWPPVSACKNSVPGGRIASGKWRPGRVRLKDQAVGLFTCLCFLGAVIDLILN